MIEELLEHVSYLGIIVVLILTGTGLPIPDEVMVVAAGAASSSGYLNPWGAFAACLGGALTGDSIIFAIGYYFGHTLVWKHPRFARWLHAERQAKIAEMIQKHGLKAFFLSRFVVGIRAPVYLTAGTLRMPFKRFLLFDLLGATTVVGIFFGLSYLYGRPLTEWIRQLQWEATGVALAVVLFAAGWFGIRYYWRRRAGLIAEQPYTAPRSLREHEETQMPS